jgi:hypothetical protein
MAQCTLAARRGPTLVLKLSAQVFEVFRFAGTESSHARAPFTEFTNSLNCKLTTTGLRNRNDDFFFFYPFPHYKQGTACALRCTKALV